MNKQNLFIEFDAQVSMLLKRGYPAAAKLSNADFLRLLTPLRDRLNDIQWTEINFERGHLPFVVVIKNTVVPAELAMSLTDKDGKKGVTKLYPLTSRDFRVSSDEQLPEGPVYLLVDIDRGKDTINLPPNNGLKRFREIGRHPITIDEGIAILTHYPGFLIKNNCFSLLASRHTGDKRVPAIWINSKKEPNLGWCWDGNPHTWLGSASCSRRFGTTD